MPGSDTDPLLKKVSQMVASGRARPAIPEYVKVSRQLQRMFETTISSADPIDDIVRRTSEFIGVIADLPCRGQ
jgi:maltose-binding protein MalE